MKTLIASSIPLIKKGDCTCLQSFNYAKNNFYEKRTYSFSAWEHEETGMIITEVFNKSYGAALFKESEDGDDWKSQIFIGKVFLENFSPKKEFRNQRLEQLLAGL